MMNCEALLDLDESNLIFLKYMLNAQMVAFDHLDEETQAKTEVLLEHIGTFLQVQTSVLAHHVCNSE